MKKILFGSAAAICTVVGLSSFKTSHNFASEYWFKVNSDVFTSSHSLRNSDVTLAQTFSATPPSMIDCPAPTANFFYCLVGFDQSQITHNGLSQTILKTTGSGIAPAVTVSQRTSL